MKAPSLLFASLLLSANWALAWTPVAESALRSALESSGYTLIACRSGHGCMEYLREVN